MKETTFMSIFGIAVAVGIMIFICLMIYFTIFPDADRQFLNVFLIVVISILGIIIIQLVSKPKVIRSEEKK